MRNKLFPMFSVAIFLCFFMAACGPAVIQPDYNFGTVEGRVLYQDGSPVVRIYCTMRSDTTGTTYSRSTDEGGYFSNNQIPKGNYKLEVYKYGYQTVNMAVTIKKNETTNVGDITLISTSYGPLNGTVTASVTGQTLAGVGITVTTGSATATATSDGNGKYSFASLSFGSHPITAQITGYQDFSSTVNIQNQTSNVFDIKMISVASPTPSPGYGNVTGKVVDTSGSALADVQVTLQKDTSSTTDSSGYYTVQNLTPGTRTLSYAKTGYQTATQDVNVEANNTVTAKTVTLASTSDTLVTTLVSKRINLPEVGDAQKPDVSNYGEKVVFHSSGNVISGWGTPNGVSQVYVWTRKTGTITRLSNSAVSSSTSGADKNSYNAKISGNGEYVVFESTATNILPDGLALNSITDVYIIRLSDLKIARISNDSGDANLPGNSDSTSPDISGDGTAVVFTSTATNIDGLAPIANNGWSHIYGAKINNMTPSVRVMLDMRFIAGVATEGSDGGFNPGSANPAISYDGSIVTFSSRADNICSNNPSTAATHIFRCNTKSDPTVGWNTYITQNDGTDFPAGTISANPAINSDGTKIAFETNANIFTTGGTYNIMLWKQGSNKLTLVSKQLSGTALNFKKAQIDNTGKYVSFLSSNVGPGAPGYVNPKSDNISITGMVYVRDMEAANVDYTYGSVGSSGQLPNVRVLEHAMSPDGLYLTFETKATNLTTDTYTENISDIFIRKWK
ncbi:MAG: carboxypeptidase regulatory-like domain-containing protein [Firmicutes bacterium]|nr:carboxypeptidase regulatory-like domain-containing protein [Bacillota bacterium]